MPSSSPLDPKAAVFAPKISNTPSKRLDPKAPAFLPARDPKIVQGLLQDLQASHLDYQTYELLDPSEGQFETTTKGLFSLPLELRLKIYNLVLDEEYEIHETALPALLRTRLQITREFYQLCNLRIVFVLERRFDFFTHPF
ncbi:hypothetical protein QM012_001557 [Aureobasidium pullulans]|uniref:F-box domain-containing protein n=1 Tax=Aureobasidium pullulans TaxID=5580 RepID=A0ABR0TEF0_AURPU